MRVEYAPAVGTKGVTSLMAVGEDAPAESVYDMVTGTTIGVLAAYAVSAFLPKTGKVGLVVASIGGYIVGTRLLRHYTVR